MLTDTEQDKIAQAMQKPALLSSDASDLAWSVLLAGRYVNKAAIIKGDEYTFKANPSANHALKHLDNYAALWLDNGDMLVITPTVTSCCSYSRFSEFYMAQASAVGDSTNRIVDAYMTGSDTYGFEEYTQHEYTLYVRLETGHVGVSLVSAMNAYELEHDAHAFEARLIEGENHSYPEPARALALLGLAREHRLTRPAIGNGGLAQIVAKADDPEGSDMLRVALWESGIKDVLEEDLSKWFPADYKAIVIMDRNNDRDAYTVRIEKDGPSDDDSQ